MVVIVVIAPIVVIIVAVIAAVTVAQLAERQVIAAVMAVKYEILILVIVVIDLRIAVVVSTLVGIPLVIAAAVPVVDIVVIIVVVPVVVAVIAGIVVAAVVIAVFPAVEAVAVAARGLDIRLVDLLAVAHADGIDQIVHIVVKIEADEMSVGGAVIVAAGGAVLTDGIAARVAVGADRGVRGGYAVARAIDIRAAQRAGAADNHAVRVGGNIFDLRARAHVNACGNGVG